MKYNTDWDHPPEYCKTCSESRVKVNRNEKGTFQATKKDGTLLFTFGRCSAPPSHKQGGKADIKREWANRGYYWVAVPGTPHETYIIDRNPVVDGFIQQAGHMETTYSKEALHLGWIAMAIAVLGSDEE
ncbi:hypothetical protein C5B42_05670 [Candidatus Cerribacteria bacterium 'Amazon FNV 2010 28 9']|uniref:Uncharacterized protein n=1 Tax=Candidatus Cerribacteria bacterium 'Amazon FNV 2010 28 9' TaxID=2081795 RepID=A0A317JS34_9BACT|nr:MAG: hypothetical protein C5B42_05670 [Candidatus Cerribacteria bacterium 'Amazon FNV 2010 28 9']